MLLPARAVLSAPHETRYAGYWVVGVTRYAGYWLVGVTRYAGYWLVGICTCFKLAYKIVLGCC